jgi:hypothetical protein
MYDTRVLMIVLRSLRLLVAGNPQVGVALIPHYRQFLVPMNQFLDHQRNIGDRIDYGQRKHTDIGEEVLLTLETIERASGPTAFANIKRIIPTCKPETVLESPN